MIVAILAYFDENPNWLRELVDTLPKLGVKHLIAADGAYADFPTAGLDSGGLKPLRQRCGSHQIQLHHTIPTSLWADQMAKRSFLIAEAEKLTSENDWYFIVDADELVTHAPSNLQEQLDELEPEWMVGEALLWDDKGGRAPLRMFFRAMRGLHVTGNHYTYQLPDGRRLWGSHPGDGTGLEPAVRVPVYVQHRDHDRTRRRLIAKGKYYTTRHETKECAWCGQPATESVPVNWRWQGDQLVGDRADACTECFPARYEESRQVVEAAGIQHPDLRERKLWFR